jgi:short-subunit dehydrogenase
MEVDFFAQIALTKIVLGRMLEQQDGHIVVTSSVAGKHGVPFRSAYCAAKHALHGYFETLRIELLDDNIRACLLVIAGVTSNVAEHALVADGSEFGHDDFNTGSGMTPDQCAEQALDAILANEYEPVISIAAAQQALQIRATDPVGFTRRMHGMMKWMAK